MRTTTAWPAKARADHESPGLVLAARGVTAWPRCSHRVARASGATAPAARTKRTEATAGAVPYTAGSSRWRRQRVPRTPELERWYHAIAEVLDQEDGRHPLSSAALISGRP